METPSFVLGRNPGDEYVIVISARGTYPRSGIPKAFQMGDRRLTVARSGAEEAKREQEEYRRMLRGEEP
jgi:hypothetical protein